MMLPPAGAAAGAAGGAAPGMMHPHQQQQQQGSLPPVGPEEQRLSEAAGRAAADAQRAIAQLAGCQGNGESELSAHIQDIFRALRALISDMKMAVDEQET